MTRTKTALFNSISTAIFQIVLILSGFVIPRIMITIYGSEINGLVSSLTQFISYFALVEAGLGGAAIFALYKPLAANDTEEINLVLSSSRRFYIKSGIVFLILLILLALIYPLLVTVSSLGYFMVFSLVFILGFSSVLDFFTLSKYRVLLTADQKVYIISIASIIQVLIFTFVIYILSVYSLNIVFVRLVALSSVFARSIILYLYVKKRYRYLNFNLTSNVDQLKSRWDVLYWQIAGTIHVGGPIIIATIFTDLKVVSIFVIFNMVIGGIRGLLKVVINGLYSTFGNLLVTVNTNKFGKVFSEFEYFYYFIISVVFSVAMIMIMPFIRLYTSGVTDISYDLPVLGFLFVINGLLYSIKNPQGMLVMAAGMYKETKIQVTIQALISIIIGSLLAVFIGVYGILIGMIISNFYRWIDLTIFTSKNITKTKSRFSFFRQLRVFIIVIIITCIFYFLGISNDKSMGYLQWIITSTFLVAISSFVAIGFGFTFDRVDIKKLFTRFVQLVKKI